MELVLPHGQSFRLIDKILEFDPQNVRVLVAKTFTGSEVWNSADHFPGEVIMPAVMVLESMAQSIIPLGQIILEMKKTPRFLGADNFRIRKEIHPSDTLVIEAVINKVKSTIGKADTLCKIDGKEAASASILFGF